LLKHVVMKISASLLSFALALFVVAPCLRAQSGSADHEAIKTKLKQTEDAWVKALADPDHGVAVVANFLAADYSGYSPKGEHQNKSQLLESMKNETDTVTSSSNDSMDVHVYAPNLATVCGTTTEKGKDKAGKEFTHFYAWVDTWMERNGKWECIAEAVLIPAK
jgi:hypothetical protein